MFYKTDDIIEHFDHYGHWIICETCGNKSYNSDQLIRHLNDYGHWIKCETCGDEFYNSDHLVEHLHHYKHWIKCETCKQDFRTQRACNRHMNDQGHWVPKIPCETCGLKFHTQSAVQQHMTENIHYESYCPTCDRHFQNENNLRMHLNSKAHLGISVTCPFCRSRYTTAGGVVHHLERGCCQYAPQLNRETIHRLIRERDRDSLIATKQSAWSDEDNGTYSATGKAWDDVYWECHICHKKFNSNAFLNTHLNSPVHKQKIYHCPNKEGGCHKHFNILAGLLNHLENGSCGYPRFESFQKQLRNVLTGQGAIYIR
ncbi:zinc finger protein [Aspergillus campestris IBT 28561]|uniref:Zinc finger protein n=1 Tax=Aspergillus campestris (strain IBT 28561) TaxID=1392248 RepID=A0A2I1CR83_ASPC2|nr:zinc finger protein [Aspergillus campestris IBT 28561]PKY00130.1 zinc finger protein [Aspergillus campestris IBT 28561]